MNDELSRELFPWLVQYFVSTLSDNPYRRWIMDATGFNVWILQSTPTDYSRVIRFPDQ